MRAAVLIHSGLLGSSAGAAIILAGLCGSLAHAGPAECLDRAEAVRAAEAADARSLKLGDGRLVRLAGIEPFDLLRPDLAEAEAALHARLSELAGAKALSVQLASGEPDRYGRLVALVAVDGALVQEALAAEGLALAFAGGAPLACFDRILAAEEAARRAGRGFWAGVSLPRATPDALLQQVGHFVIFEGRVISVGNRSARTYLNFGYTWSEDVTVEIEAADRDGFGGEEALAALAGRKVRVRGFLEEKAGPMLALRSPMQLEVIDADVGD